MTRVIETDEAGDLVISPELLREMLGEAPLNTRYVLEIQGDKISISLEKTAQENEAAQSKPSIEQWERQWRAVQEQVSADWPAGVSAVDIISEMRR